MKKYILDYRYWITSFFPHEAHLDKIQHFTTHTRSLKANKNSNRILINHK